MFNFFRYVDVILEGFKKLIKEKLRLVEFLMQRKNGKKILLQVLRELLAQMPSTMVDIPIIFDKINSVYRDYLQTEIQNVMGTPLQNNIKPMNFISENYKYKLMIDQNDMYGHIFSNFLEEVLDSKMIIWVLLEYIR